MREKIAKSIEIIQYLLFILMAFLMPLLRSFVPPLIIVSVFFALVYFFLLPSTHRWNAALCYKLLPFLLLFALYLGGVLYSTNKDAAYFDIETKLSLLAFPAIAYLMLAHPRRNFCSFACLRWVSFAFVLASLLLFTQLLKAIFQTPDMVFSLENIFNWGYIAVNAQIGLHSSYAALYFAFSAAICLFSISNFRTWYGKTKWAYLWSAFAFIFALIFIFAVFVVGAKSGLLSLGSLFVVYFIYEIGFQKHYVKSAVTLLSFCFFVGSLIYFYPSVLNKMKDTFSTVQQMHLQKHELYQGSTAYRVYFWETALATIQDKPLFGYGTGDVKEALAPHYSDTLRNVLCSTIPEKDTYLIENHIPPYNPHNQFLQTSIAIGLLGLSVFLSIFVCGLYWAFRTRSILFATLNLLFLVNCLTESMLETQAGIVFFVFFYFLFFLYLYPKLSEKTETAILKEK